VRRAVLAAAVLHLAVLACLVHGRASSVSIEESSLQYIGAAMAASEARARADLAAAAPPAPALFPTPGSAGPTAPREEGSAGSPSHTNEARQRIASGDGRRPRAPTEDAIGSFGMISLVAGQGGREPGTSPWADERGTSARGNLFGETIDDAAGVAGLGLSSAGSGAGEHGEAIALASIGTVGHGSGVVGGGGLGHARLPATHVTRSPSVSCRCGETYVSGRLPPEAIQRIVRQSFGRFRACYEQGLERDAKLEGRIAVKFVIDRSGAVSFARSSESSLADVAVDRCVVRAFESLAFPQPEGGIVTVVYPLVFTSA
jgi:TonB family protein